MIINGLYNSEVCPCEYGICDECVKCCREEKEEDDESNTATGLY